MAEAALVHAQTPPADSAAAHLPRFVVLAEQSVIVGPVASDSAPVRLARSRGKLPIEVTASGPGEFLSVQVHGAIELTGLVRREALGVVVCEPGPLGEHFYAGRGNVLPLRSDVIDGQVKVAGEVLLLNHSFDAKAAGKTQFHSLPYSAAIEERRLCNAPRGDAKDAEDSQLSNGVGEIAEGEFPPGTQFLEVPRKTAVSLFARPAGALLHGRSGDQWGYTLARLEHAGKWDRVAAGDGPYLLGWMPARPVRKKSPQLADVLGLMATSAAPFALHTAELTRLPLHEVPAGLQIQQRGTAFARLTRPGHARVSTLRDGWQYVVVAVNDDLVVEGWIQPARLGVQAKENHTP